MFVQQTFVAIGRVLPAIIAPAIITDLRIDAVWIGVYFGISACASLIAQLGCGSFIVRYGAMRVSQIVLLFVAAGTALSALGTPLGFILSAVLCGGGGAVSTPASSHLLSRCAEPRYFPLVFSVKQTAVPIGLLLAGVLAPLLTEWTGWRTTMVISAIGAAAFALALSPLPRIYDTDRVPTRTFQLSDFKTTLTAVLGTAELRGMSFACLAYNGLQAVVLAYLVIYLTTIGYTPVAAGFIFSVAVAVAVPCRILWGWLSSGPVSPRAMMAVLALGMSASVILLALSGAGWPTIVVGAIACAISATALSWHGVLLAETARAAPPDMRGGVTGGVLSFGQVGGLVLPLLYSGLLDLTGSYGVGFAVCGLPALLVGVHLLRLGAAEKK